MSYVATPNAYGEYYTRPYRYGYGYRPWGWGRRPWGRRWGGPWGRRYGWAGLGETSGWAQFIVSPEEVYIWRAHLHGAKLVAPDQALLFVRAVGKGQNQNLDVRGIALDRQSDTDWSVDVVLTSSENVLGLIPRNADGVAQQVLLDPAVRQVFPQLSISEPQFRQLTGPKAAIDHWRSQALLWDHLLGGDGGPTDTFAQPAEYSIVKGTADDGKLAQPWVVAPAGLGPGGEKKPPGSTENTVLLLGLAAIGGYIVVQAMKDKKKGRKP